VKRDAVKGPLVSKRTHRDDRAFVQEFSRAAELAVAKLHSFIFRTRLAAASARGACICQISFEKFGGCAQDRTVDPLIKSQLLYQLSYTPGGRLGWRGYIHAFRACPALRTQKSHSISASLTYAAIPAAKEALDVNKLAQRMKTARHWTSAREAENNFA
jgi:hypothetical protein